MELHFNVTKAARKAMVEAISKELNIEAKYLGAPTFAYEIGAYRVERDATLVFEQRETPEGLDEIAGVINSCVMATGESPIEWDDNVEEEEPEEVERRGLTVSVPLDKVNVCNLTNLLDAKETLIKKALGIDDLSVEVHEDVVSFPWFKETPTMEESMAYSVFIALLCKMSVEQKRINPIEKKADNEKYAFRCFLLRLGFIGDKFKTERRILLSKLEGSAAFKTVKKEVEAK